MGICPLYKRECHVAQVWHPEASDFERIPAVKLLHIDSSILGPHSVSRILSGEIVDQQRRLHPGLEIIYRDLAADPLMHLSPAHIAAFHGASPKDSAVLADIADGGRVLDELFAASILVIGAPMYNFAISSQLTAWIDRLVVAGRTFRYTEKGIPESLLPKGKKAIIASSRGGSYGEDSPAAFLDHQESYLQATLGFIGITDVIIIRAENIGKGVDAKNAALAAARREISALAA
jgi:FMN-dependent NADH-azoreductase